MSGYQQAHPKIVYYLVHFFISHSFSSYLSIWNKYNDNWPIHVWKNMWNNTESTVFLVIFVIMLFLRFILKGFNNFNNAVKSLFGFVYSWHRYTCTFLPCMNSIICLKTGRKHAGNSKRYAVQLSGVERFYKIPSFMHCFCFVTKVTW